jgi:hypothetical protein
MVVFWNVEANGILTRHERTKIENDRNDRLVASAWRAPANPHQQHSSVPPPPKAGQFFFFFSRLLKQ